MMASGAVIRMPKIEQGTHIIEWLAETGLYENGMNGPAVLTHKEIHAWAELSQSGPMPEEVKLMRSLSAEFCSFYHSCDNDTPEPMKGELTQDEINDMARIAREARRSRLRKN